MRVGPRVGGGAPPCGEASADAVSDGRFTLRLGASRSFLAVAGVLAPAFLPLGAASAGVASSNNNGASDKEIRIRKSRLKRTAGRAVKVGPQLQGRLWVAVRAGTWRSDNTRIPSVPPRLTRC